MQVYGFLEKAQLENVASDLSNTLTGLVWFNTVGSRFKFYDGTAVRTIVDENSTQTLVNKIITGSQMASFSPDGVETITAPVVTGNMLVDQHQLTYMDALHQVTPASPSAGGVRIYSKNDNQLYKLDSEGNEVAIGTGGGGLDVFHIENFEVNNAADFSTGNNASFLGGGVLAGTLTDETVAPISGKRTLKYTQAAGSLNDFFASPVFDIDPKQAGNDAGVTFYFDYDGNKDDIKIVIYDVDNTSVISSELDLITDIDNPTRFSFSVFVPRGTTQLRWGAQVVVENIGAVLNIDDTEFSSDPFVYKEIVRENVYSAKIQNNGTATITSQNIDFVQSVSRTSTGVVDVVFVPGFFTQIPSISGTVSAGGANTSTPMFYSITTSGFSWRTFNSGGTTTDSNVEFIAQRQGADYGQTTEHVITPAKNSETTTKYLASDVTTVSDFEVFGGLTVGDRYLVTGQVETNANGATLRVSFNSGALGTGTQYHDSEQFATSSQTIPRGMSFFFTATSETMYAYKPSAAGTVRGTGDSSGTYLQVTNTNSHFLAATPVQKVAIIKDVKSSGTNGGSFTSGAWQTRDLNTVTGDSEIVSLSSNQFTLKKGKYLAKASAPAYFVDSHKLKLRNITSSTDDIIGSSEYCPNVGDSSIVRSFVEGTITISTDTTYEIQHRCSSTQGTFGFGLASGLGVDEVYTQVEITKLR